MIHVYMYPFAVMELYAHGRDVISYNENVKNNTFVEYTKLLDFHFLIIIFSKIYCRV